jgi:transcriptional regulator with PAS, ATPase and Fis domain
VGSGRGLSQSGLTEAAELDITWVPDVGAAVALPRVHFDGLLLEAFEADGLGEAIGALTARCPRRAMLLAIPEDEARKMDPTLAESLGAVLTVAADEAGAGFVEAVNDTLDRIYADSTVCPLPAKPSACDAPTSGRPRLVETLHDPAADAPRVVTQSPAMREVSSLIDTAASSPSTVLVTGETGVGKEVVARALHRRSARQDEPFVAINCAAFPETLLESELFGHVRGAFTGADRNKVGLFEAAAEGTLFLDEIAETGLPLQAKLLRVLQEREFRPVGSTRSRPTRCRIVAATNRVLADEVQAGHFREDLFYRLNVFPIRVPPLRERRPDILPLARHFLALHGPREGKIACHLSLATAHLLEGYGWPGNVRELENEMLRALMLTPSGQLITPRALSPKLVEILEPVAHGARPDETLKEALDRIESWMLRRALANNGGRKTQTARKLGLTREGLYKKLKRLGIE